jgi:hypothetical protein
MKLILASLLSSLLLAACGTAEQAPIEVPVMPTLAPTATPEPVQTPLPDLKADIHPPVVVVDYYPSIEEQNEWLATCRTERERIEKGVCAASGYSPQCTRNTFNKAVLYCDSAFNSWISQF